MMNWDATDAGSFDPLTAAGRNACGPPAGAISRAGQGCADQRCQPGQNQKDRPANNPDPFQFGCDLHPESFHLLTHKRHIRLDLGPEMIDIGLAGDTAGDTGMDRQRDGFGLRLFKACITQALDLGNRVKGGFGHGGFRLQGLWVRPGGLCPDFQPARRWRRGSTAVVTAAVLATASFAQAAQEPQAWLDAMETRLVEASGHAIAMPGDPPVVFVFHGGLSTLWMLDATDLAEADTARVTATATVLRDDGTDPKGGQDTGAAETARAPLFRALWRDGSMTEVTRPTPALTVAPGRHPLARAYDRLLAEPLARPVAGLVAGSRFGVDGLVRRPDTSAKPGGAIFWQSQGERITLEMGDGTLVGVALETLVQALQGSAPRQRGSGQ